MIKSIALFIERLVLVPLPNSDICGSPEERMMLPNAEERSKQVQRIV